MRKWTVRLLMLAVGIAVLAGLFFGARRSVRSAQRTACYSNLMQIDGAKEEAARSIGIAQPNLFAAEEACPVSLAQISKYMRGTLKCPAGGTYSIGYYGEEPMCSLHGVYGWDDMNRAAFAGDIAGVNRALDEGYGPNRASFTWTPLHSAALAGHKDVVSLLLQKGARVNPMTRLGQTPLDLATDLDVVSILQKHGGREVFNVYTKRSQDVARVAAVIDVLVKCDEPATNTHRFAFELSNKTDHAMSVKVLSSMVCEDGTREAQMPSSHADNWLCPAGTILSLAPHATHRFDLVLLYKLEQYPRSYVIRSKATGFWNDEGYHGSSGGGSFDGHSIGAWLLVDISTGDEEINGVPVHSGLIYFARKI